MTTVIVKLGGAPVWSSSVLIDNEDPAWSERAVTELLGIAAGVAAHIRPRSKGAPAVVIELAA